MGIRKLSATTKRFSVESYEISKPRAQYAKDKLRLKVYSSLADIEGTFDIFFSSHVLEHVSSVRDTIQFGMNLLKNNGLFIALTPNGSKEFQSSNFESWNKLWVWFIQILSMINSSRKLSKIHIT
jgi:2-polyprenyl-3-methyl-5-hydroxy-6-metoxy-1,4-benzoquinol methylase